MADDIISLGVKVTGGDDILKVSNSINTLDRNVKTLSKTYDRGNLSVGAYYTGLKSQIDALVKMGVAQKKAEKYVHSLAAATIDAADASKDAAAASKAEAVAVKAYTQARREATEANQRYNAEAKALVSIKAQEAKEEERLKNKFVEGYTAMNIYTKELNDLAVARKKDIITASQQSAAVEALNADMAAGTGAFKTYGNSVQRTRSRQSQLGVLFQQTGYQVGDFAVQIQSGQNAMVAFGQQATQLIGTFGMLSKSTKMIAAFAGLGIAVPILTAIGAAFMRTSEKGKDSAESIKDSFSVLPEFFKGLGVNIASSFDVAFKEIESKYGEMFSRLAEIKLEQQKSAIGSSFKSVVTPTVEPSILDKLGAALAPGMVGGNLEALENIERQTKALYSQSLAVKAIEDNYLKSVGAAKSFDEILDLTKSTQKSLSSVSKKASDAFILQAEELGLIREETSKKEAETSKKELVNQELIDRARETSEAERILGEQMLSLERDKALAQFNADLESTNKYIEAMFQNRTLYYSIRFSGDSTVMGQSLNPSGSMKPSQSYEELLGMGWTPEDLKRIGMDAPKGSSGGAGGGGGGSNRDSQLDSFISSLMTERETLEQWRSEQVDLLGQFNETELEIIGGHAEAKFRIEQEYSDKLVALKSSESQVIKSQSSAMYSALGGFLDQFAGKSKAAAVASVALNKALSIAQAIQNTSVAYTKALIMDPTGAMAARVAMLGKIQVGLIAATGLSQAASAASGGASGTVSGSASGASATMPTQAVAATPQRVIIEGIDRDSLFSGEQLSKIFEAIYEENENRGMVFEVAR